MTITRTIVICAICGAVLGLFRMHGGWLLIAPAICSYFVYKRAVARRRAR